MLLRKQDEGISAFLAPDSQLTTLDLVRSGVDPDDVEKISELRNIANLQVGISTDEQPSEDIIPASSTPVPKSSPIPVTDDTSGLAAKGFDVEKQIPKDVVDLEGIKKVGAVEASIKGKEKEFVNWADEAAQRQIKTNIIGPKLNYFMDVGGRAYKELKDVAKKELGVDLDFSKGGTNYYKNLLVKKGLGAAKLTPLMTALDNLRPELGTELMRQLGPFRSAQMAAKFERTVANFSGNIKEDIANMTTTIAKNAANTELIDESGNILPDSVRDQKMKLVEATLIRRYNFMYRNMELIEEPYLAGRDFRWIAENSNFNDNELLLIEDAVRANSGYDRTSIVAKLIEQGIL